MLLRITKGLFKSSWWLVLGMLVMVAAYLSLGRLATFSVEANQHQIEDYLRDRGFEFVDLGTIAGDWQVHDPRFIVRDISVKPLGEPALDVDLLTIRVDSVRSLLSRTPIITEVEISGIRFAVERDEDEFWIRGFERGDGSLDFDYVLESLPHLELLKVDGIDVALIGPNLEMQLVSHWDRPWIVSAEDDVKQLSLPLSLEKKQPDGTTQSHQIRVSGYYQGDLRESSDFVARLYLEAPKIDLEDFTPTFQIAGQKLSTARLNSRIWLTLEPDNLDVTGEAELTNVSLEGDSDNLLDEVITSFRFKGESISHGTLSIPNVLLKHKEFTFELDDINLAIDTGPAGSMLAGQLDHVNVSELTRLIEFAGQKELLPKGLSNALLSVSPGGGLRNLLFITDTGEGGPKLVSTLADFSIEAYLGVPAIDTLNGFISLQPDKGYLDIDNDAFEMNFQSMFESAWSFDAGRGRIAYSVDEGIVSVASGLIELLEGDLAAYGKLSVNLPPDRDFHTWGMTIGISDVGLRAADTYVPNNIPDDLRSWVRSAVKGGVANETGLTIHGALFRGSPAVRKAHDLYLKVEDTEIEYHPDWPPATNLTATIHIDNHHVGTDDATGKMYTSDIVDAEVFVALPASGQADTVMVTASVSGPFEDAIRALNETPLAETTSGMAEEWSAEGEMLATLGIEVPIGPRGNEEVSPDVLVSIEDVFLQMPEFDLDITDLRGGIRYNTVSGLSSKGFSGTTFGRPISGTIASQLHGEGGEIVVQVNGAVDVPVLYEWSDQILLSRASGVLDYKTLIHVPYGGLMDKTYVEAFSDLRGVIVDLPDPLSKTEADSVREFKYRQTFIEPGYRVDMSMDDSINASLKIEDGIATGGRIHFGTAAYGAVTFDSIRMSGELPYLDFGAWETVIEGFGEISDVSIEDELAANIASAELSIDEFLLYYLPLEDIEMLVTRGDDHWIASMRNEMLEGEVKVPDDDAAPLGVNLNWLSFESEGDNIDPLYDVNPLEVANVDFSTDQLLLDGEDYGSWSFKYRTTEDAGRFEDLAAVALGVQIPVGALGEWRFENGRHSSRFTGGVLIDDLAEAQQKFGFATSVEGEGFKLTADVGWDGSPAMVDIEKVIGEIAILEGKGRFVQAEAGGLKLLGIFDFASLARRFRLDFSDVIDKGFEFTDIQGTMSFDEGAVDVQEPIVIYGTSGKFTVGGSMDIVAGTLDNDMIVTLPVGRTLPWYAAYSAIATGPLAGAGVMLAQKVFEDQINQMSSAKYKISGTIEEPDIEFVSIFNDSVREAPQSNL